MRLNLPKQWPATLIAIAAIAAPLAGQTPAAALPTDDNTVQMSAFVITGSNIPTAADATDVPVAVLGKHQIDATGISTNALDLIRKSVPAFAGGRSNSGNSNASNTNQVTAGGSQMFLRNLPTLVLVNGRRVTTSSVGANGGKNFVDVNMFPVSAIDHIEVLSDGASAIYGSDAIGGVVNIILKSNFSGVEIGGRYAATNDTGHYSERSAYVIAGAKNDATSITVSGNWSKTDPLLQSQRPFIEYNPRPVQNYPGSVGANYLAASLNSPSQTNPTGTKATAPNMAALVANGTYLPSNSPFVTPFNVAPYTYMLLAQELKSAMLDFNSKIYKDKLVLFGNATYSKAHSYNQTGTALSTVLQLGVTVPAGSPYNPTTSNVPGVVVGTTGTPQQTINDAKAYLTTLGLRGQINEDWNWETGYTYSNSQVTQSYTNQVFQPNLNAAIAGGYDANGNAVAGGAYSKVISGFNINGPLVVQPALDPFARTSVNPASLANIYGTEVAKTKASLGAFDAKIVGMPFSVPAGKVGFALGTEYRNEVTSALPDNNSYNASTDPTKHNWSVGGTYFDPFARGRTIASYYTEIRVPVTSPTWNFPAFHALDVSLAGRSEKYNDSGTSRVPKIGFRWQPIDEQFTVRFTYGKSFVAPLLLDEYGPANYFLQAPPVTGVNSGVNIQAGQGNNPKLGPGYAWSRSTGVVYSPKFIKGLTVSANYVDVYMKGYQVGLGLATILNDVQANGAASPYFSAVAANGAPGQAGATNAPFAAPGSLFAYLNSPSYSNNVYALDHRINSGGVLTRAVDFSVDYQLETESHGRFDFNSTGSYLYSVLVKATDAAPWFEYAGYSNNANVFAGSNSKWNTYSTVDWKIDNFDFLVGNLYRSKIVDINSGTLPATWLATHPTTYVPYYTSWDAQVGYTIGKATANSLWSYLNGVKVTVGVNNVFNRMPPYAPLSQPSLKNNNNADVAAYSPIGRLFFVSLSTKF